MEERLERLEHKVDALTEKQTVSFDALLSRMTGVEERMYGVEDRMDALNSKVDVGFESIRSDFRLIAERVDSLRATVEGGFANEQKERSADRKLLFAIARDHDRRLRAIERLQRRQAAQS